MKFFASLVLAVSVAFSAAAQSPTLLPTVAGDTVVNTGTVNKTFTASAGYSAVGAQVVITEIAGTTAGTATFQGSLNGTNWETIGTAFTLTDVATQAKFFSVAGNPYHYYRVSTVGSGTMTAKVQLYVVLRKYSTQ
jgi:hypothetical protein